MIVYTVLYSERESCDHCRDTCMCVDSYELQFLVCVMFMSCYMSTGMANGPWCAVVHSCLSFMINMCGSLLIYRLVSCDRILVAWISKIYGSTIASEDKSEKFQLIGQISKKLGCFLEMLLVFHLLGIRLQEIQ